MELDVKVDMREFNRAIYGVLADSCRIQDR